MRVIDVSLNEFNAVANEPDVLRYLNPKLNRIDLAWIYETPGVMVKGCDGVHGAVLLIPYPDLAMEIHWFMPGDAGMRAISAVVDWTFENTHTEHLFGNCPVKNIAARCVNRWLGGRVIGQLTDEHGRECLTYTLSRADWSNKHKRGTA